jgi:hypothetical protein
LKKEGCSNKILSIENEKRKSYIATVSGKVSYDSRIK